MIVVWRITQRCNFNCAFCAFDRRLDFERHDADPEKVVRMARLIGEDAQRRGEPVLLSWLGGEPFLWRPLFEISEMLHCDFGIAISATTNGSTLHRADVRKGIIDSFSELTISIDGFNETHDHLRGAPGNWIRIARGIEALRTARDARKKMLKLRVNTILMRATASTFPDLCHTLADWGVDEISFNQLGGRDRPEFFPANRLTPLQVSELRTRLPSLRTELAARDVRLCYSDEYLARIDASSRDMPIEIKNCAPGERFLFIDEHGIIAPCSFTGPSIGMPMDQIETMDALQKIPERFRTAQACVRPGECNDCPATHMYNKFASTS
jgi:MoaA/NifB/PqqE/SkfB family radical SAM enzyme